MSLSPSLTTLSTESGLGTACCTALALNIALDNLLMYLSICWSYLSSSEPLILGFECKEPTIVELDSI
jgi:hypothetical protein